MKKNKSLPWWKKHYKELILLLFIVAITFLSIQWIHLGNDYWWHIKAGSYMVKHHVILDHDIFSWYASSQHLSWMAHEWLSEILLYGFQQLFGSLHPIIFCTFFFLGTLLLLFGANRSKMLKNIRFTMFYFILALIFLSVGLLPRPHLISYFFLVLSLGLLFDLAKHEDSKKIYLLPLIAILWANFHGGSSNLIYILCFTFFFIGLFNCSLGKLEAKPFTLKQRRKYLTVGLLSIVGIILNPQGLKLLSYPYLNMQDGLMLSTIAEWQATNPNKLNNLAIFAYFAIVLFLIFKSPRKLQLLDGILLAMFAFLSLKSIRFWPLFYLVSGFIIFDYVNETPVSLFTARLLFAFSVFFLVASIPWRPIELFTPVVPEKFIEIIKQKHPQKLYNYYDYGGYLIYRDIPVFIDGRADMYSKYNYQDYYHLSILESDYRKILDRYQFDMFLLDKGLPLVSYLEEQEEYEVLLDQGNTILYALKET